MLKKSLKLFSAVVFAAVTVVCLSSSVESGEGSGGYGEEHGYWAAVTCPNGGGRIEIEGKCCQDGQWICSYISCVYFKAPEVHCPSSGN